MCGSEGRHKITEIEYDEDGFHSEYRIRCACGYEWDEPFHNPYTLHARRIRNAWLN